MKPLVEPRLRGVLVRGLRVDISIKMIYYIQFGPMYLALPSTTEFDWQIRKIRQVAISKSVDQQTKLLRWVGSQITECGSEPTWVKTHLELIVKSSVSFLTKFWWVIISSRIRPTFTDSVLTLEGVVLVDNILTGFDIDWAWLIVK